MKPKPLTESQFLALLEKVLAKFVARDLNLRAAIQEEVTKEIRLHNHVASFTKFCEQGAVPDLKPETVAELQEQLAATFGSEASVTVTPDESRGGLMDVEITLPDRTVTSQVKVDPAAAAGGEEARQSAVRALPRGAADGRGAGLGARPARGPRARRGRPRAGEHRGGVLVVQGGPEAAQGRGGTHVRRLHRQRSRRRRCSKAASSVTTRSRKPCTRCGCWRAARAGAAATSFAGCAVRGTAAGPVRPGRSRRRGGSTRRRRAARTP